VFFDVLRNYRLCHLSMLPIEIVSGR
jgi:hypothetical protein